MKNIKIIVFVYIIMYLFAIDVNEICAQTTEKIDSNAVNEKSIYVKLVESEEITIVGFKNPKSKYDAEITELSEQQKKELDEVVAYLNDYPNTTVHIDGHSDNSGTMQQELYRAESRANAVMNYLMNKEIPKNRIFARGRGAIFPIASNNTAEGRTQNRRVTITTQPTK